MKDAVEYICNFFFGPGCGWHFLGLCLLCSLIGSKVYVNIKEDNEKKK